MKQELFFKAMLEAISLIEDRDWLARYKAFLQEEHLLHFTKRLFLYHHEEAALIQPLPYFEEEIKQDLKTSFDYFAPLFSLDVDLPEAIKNVMTDISFEHVLLLLGQRITPASVQDENAIPPLREQLWESCLQPYNTETSVAVRAWEKHVGRYENSVLGEIKGNQSEKNKKVAELILFMMEHTTWWNVFYHYKHGPVYEIRIENGQGMRWTSDGKQFIGFLEQFRG